MQGFLTFFFKCTQLTLLHSESLMTHMSYHEIISMVILFPSAESFKKGCCQLKAKVCA